MKQFVLSPCLRAHVLVESGRSVLPIDLNSHVFLVHSSDVFLQIARVPATLPTDFTSVGQLASMSPCVPLQLRDSVEGLHAVVTLVFLNTTAEDLVALVMLNCLSTKLTQLNQRWLPC